MHRYLLLLLVDFVFCVEARIRLFRCFEGSSCLDTAPLFIFLVSHLQKKLIFMSAS